MLKNIFILYIVLLILCMFGCYFVNIFLFVEDWKKSYCKGKKERDVICY